MSRPSPPGRGSGSGPGGQPGSGLGRESGPGPGGEPGSRRPRPELSDALRYAQSGTMLVAPMVALGWIGLWADRRWGTGPWLLLAGLLLGMIGGFVNFFRMVLPPRDGGAAGTGTPGPLER